MRAEISLLNMLSVSGASEFTSKLDRMSMRLQSKLGGFMSVKTKLFKRLLSVCGGGMTLPTSYNMEGDLSWTFKAAGMAVALSLSRSFAKGLSSSHPPYHFVRCG
eukprot:1156979-Pelagomonas_calceolata.AAC.2